MRALWVDTALASIEKLEAQECAKKTQQGKKAKRDSEREKKRRESLLRKRSENDRDKPSQFDELRRLRIASMRSRAKAVEGGKPYEAAKKLGQYLALRPETAFKYFSAAWDNPRRMAELCEWSGGLALRALAPVGSEALALAAQMVSLAQHGAEHERAVIWEGVDIIRAREREWRLWQSKRAESKDEPTRAMGARVAAKIVEHLGEIDACAPSSWLKWRKIAADALKGGRLPSRFDVKKAVGYHENAALGAHAVRLKASRRSYVFAESVVDALGEIVDGGLRVGVLSVIPEGSFAIYALGNVFTIGREGRELLVCWSSHGKSEHVQITLPEGKPKRGRPERASRRLCRVQAAGKRTWTRRFVP